MTLHHVSLFWRGLILDPTFFDLYRVEDDSSPQVLSYTGADGDRPFSTDETKAGFAGSGSEIERYFRERMPRIGSYVQILGGPYALPADTKAMVEHTYSRKHLWLGPELDRDAKQPGAVDPHDAFRSVIVKQWDLWNQYLKTGSPVYMGPLDVRRPRGGR